MTGTHTIHPVFDDCNLVSAAGLAPVLQLAESAGLSELLGRLTVESPNAVAKTTGLLSGMLAGADSIDDLDLLRHGGMPALFTGVRTPSTLGRFLRSFTHGHVRQLDAAGTRLLARLADRVPGLIGAVGDPEALAFIDVDDSVHQVHGYAKQAAWFGYTGVRGLNMQVAVTSTPVITGARLRKDNTASASGAAGMLAETISASRRSGVAGQIMVRADSTYTAAISPRTPHAELKNSPLAHLSSGVYTANAAWAAWAAIAVIGFTWPGPRPPPPAWTPSDGRRSRLASSAYRPASPAREDDSPCTCRTSGRGQTGGTCSGRTRQARHQHRQPDHPAATVRYDEGGLCPPRPPPAGPLAGAGRFRAAPLPRGGQGGVGTPWPDRMQQCMLAQAFGDALGCAVVRMGSSASVVFGTASAVERLEVLKATLRQ